MNNHSLENYKVRRLKRLWPKMLEVIGFAGFIAIVDFIVIKLHVEISGHILIIGSLAVIVFTIYLFRTQLFEKLKPKEFFSAGFNFRQPDDETIATAIEGIFSFSKSLPYFIHVTPPNEEIKQIFNALGEGGSNFIHIHGKPGEGKSMLAYHAIYQRERKGSTKCYSLKLDTLIDKSKDIIKDILNELDGLPCKFNAPVLKLILIDDAHRLPFAYELEKQLRIEAAQGNGRFIWVTTDLDPFDKTKRKTGELSINFQAYYLHLVSKLYRSEDARIRNLMAGRFPKLDLAIAQTKEEKNGSTKQKGSRIRDAWTFNFVASDGFAKMKEDILKLKEEEKYILYLLSAHTSIKGEEPLPVTEFYKLCKKSEPFVFELPYVEFEKTLRALFEQKPEDVSKEKRRMMLRLFEDSQKNVSAESLHFLFATNYLREASRTFPDYERNEMLTAVKAILSDDWKKFRYLSSFLRNIGNDVGMFFEQNAEWMKLYFENLQPSHFRQYGYIIRFLRKFNKSLFAEIFTDGYFHRHSSFFSQLPVTRLAALTHFICELPSEMKDKLVVQLDAIALSDTISKVTIQDLSQAADLINAFGNRKEMLLNELIEKKKLNNVIEEISKATIENLQQAADLINAFGNRKEMLLNELIKEDKLANVIEEISKATINNFSQAEAIINAFGNRKEELLNELIKEDKLANVIEEISKATINNFSQAAAIINAFGNCKEELLNELIKEDKLANVIEEISKATVENLKQAAALITAFGSQKEVLLNKLIENKKLANVIEEISKATIDNFSQVEAIITAFGSQKEVLLNKLIENKKLDNIIEEISKATIENLKQAAALITAFGSQKEVLLNNLIENKKLDNIIEEISKATIENLGQVEAIINAFGSQKEVLLNKLIENKKLDNIIEEISKATIENLKQAADLITAFGMEKDKVISQINFNLLNKQVNEWQVVALIQTSEFVKALESKAAKLLLPFCEEKFLALSYQAKGHDIIAFSTILSKLPAAEQLSVASKIPWLELLHKSPRSHSLHLSNITRIMHFYLRYRSGGPVEEVKKPLLEYLRINREDIKKMVYNTQSNNYSAFYNSVLILAGINQNETAGIIRESINGFCKRFKIFPEITIYASRLLYLFYSIDPDIAFKIICHETVNNALKDFLRSERIHENPDGAKSLIKAVCNSNKQLWQEEFMRDEKIIRNLCSYDLPAIYEEQDEDSKQMNALGLDYFKIDAADEIGNNI